MKKVICTYWKDRDNYMLPSCGNDTNQRWWKTRPDRLIKTTSGLIDSYNKSYGKYFGYMNIDSVVYSYKNELLIEVI